MTETAEPALFEEPERVVPTTDGVWRIGPAPHLWRWVLVGEDADTLLVFGHSLDDADVVDLLWQVPEVGMSRDQAEAEEHTVLRTYARILLCCPTHHPPLRPVYGCEWCQIFRRDHSEHDVEEWWEWSRAGDRTPDSWPEFFPVTLVDLEP